MIGRHPGTNPLDFSDLDPRWKSREISRSQSFLSANYCDQLL